jgi:hypothetical protein
LWCCEQREEAILARLAEQRGEESHRQSDHHAAELRALDAKHAAEVAALEVKHAAELEYASRPCACCTHARTRGACTPPRDPLPHTRIPAPLCLICAWLTRRTLNDKVTKAAKRVARDKKRVEDSEAGAVREKLRADEAEASLSVLRARVAELEAANAQLASEARALQVCVPTRGVQACTKSGNRGGGWGCW